MDWVKDHLPQQPELPDDFLNMIIDQTVQDSGLCAGKKLRLFARVNRLFAQAAREHPDNNVPSA